MKSEIHNSYYENKKKAGSIYIAARFLISPNANHASAKMSPIYHVYNFDAITDEDFLDTKIYRSTNRNSSGNNHQES